MAVPSVSLWNVLWVLDFVNKQTYLAAQSSAAHHHQWPWWSRAGQYGDSTYSLPLLSSPLLRTNLALTAQ